MYLVDANILVYTANENAQQHESSVAWLDSAINDSTRSVGIPWTNLIAYLRITTSKHVVSSDQGFARFAGAGLVEWIDPTTAPRDET